MPLDPSIPLQTQQGSPLQTLSGLLQMRNTAQEYQNMQTQQQIGQAELQQQQNKLGEYNAARQVLSDPSQFMGSDGNLDMGKLSPVIMRVAPTVGPQMLQGISQANAEASAAKGAVNTLDQQERGMVGNFALAQLGKDPKEAMANLDAFGKLNPNLAPAIGFAQKYLLGPNLNNPDAFNNGIRHLATSVMSPGEQKGFAQPEGYQASNGPVSGFMNTNPVPGNVGIVPGTTYQNLMKPGEQDTLVTNPVTGGYAVQHRDAFGNIIGVNPVPGGQGVYQPQPGDIQAIPGLSAERDQARGAMLSAGTQHENNRIILDNIDNVGATGIAGPYWRNIKSAMGFVGNDPTDTATAYDMVGKGLERSAIQAAQSMGPQTNAGLQAQITANGNLHYTPSAIKQITKLNDAIVSGAQAYQPGLEAAIQANPQIGVLAKRQFDAQWGANFDPRIFELTNAQRNGDKAEINQILQSLGGPKSKAALDLAQKAQNLHLLATQGHL